MFKKLLPIVFLFAGFQVNAAIITSDDVYYDGNLEWLHFNFTDGMTALESHDEYSDQGFRLAFATEASDFISTWFGTSIVNGSLHTTNHNSQRAAFWNEFTFVHPNYGSWALAADGLLYGTDGGGYIHDGATSIVPFGQGNANYAYMMVRGTVVPEPSMIALFGLGLVGLVFNRQRRQS
jgi:hypothetical protein